jgi:hypothetical protein
MNGTAQQSRSMRAVGALLILAGLGTFAGTAAMTANDETDAAEALAQQSFVEGQCTIVSMTAEEHWMSEDRRPTIVTVNLVVHAPGRDVHDVRYVYPEYWWNPVSAAAARTSTLAPQANIACYYDAANPSHAVLVRRAPPPSASDPVHAADSGSPWIPAGIVGGSFLLFGIMALVIKPDPNARRHDD